MIHENLFLIVLALVWIIIAIFQDFRKREVANWLNFSLIAIALAYRAFVSLSLRNHWFLIYGLIGFLVFFVLANVFYYSRVFAGGDAKLLMGLGVVLPFSSSLFGNLYIFLYFIFLLLFFGGIYGLIFSVVLAIRHKQKLSKEFSKQFEKNKKLLNSVFFVAVMLAIFVLISGEYLFMAFPILLLIFPFLYIYGKAVEESCMIKTVNVAELTIGDWLYEEVRAGKKTIKPNWEGLDEKELKLLQKRKKQIKIKQGIPFTPAFLLAFIALIWVLV